MPGGLGPRFALEAGFLILLAAVAAYARLDAAEIILVMAGGWLLVSVFEVLAARRERVYLETPAEPPLEVDEALEESAEEPQAEPRVSWFRRPADSPPEPPEPADDVITPDPVPEPEVVSSADDEATGEIQLPKRRRWLRRRAEPQRPPAEAESRPSARHVRLIRGETPGDSQEPEAAGRAESTDAEAGGR